MLWVLLCSESKRSSDQLKGLICDDSENFFRTLKGTRVTQYRLGTLFRWGHIGPKLVR